jgi:hypothetical protein
MDGMKLTVVKCSCSSMTLARGLRNLPKRRDKVNRTWSDYQLRYDIEFSILAPGHLLPLLGEWKRNNGFSDPIGLIQRRKSIICALARNKTSTFLFFVDLCLTENKGVRVVHGRRGQQLPMIPKPQNSCAATPT